MKDVGISGQLRELHLFAGAGGGILGGILCGHRTVCAVEIEPYCRKVLLQRQRDGVLPRFPIWDDVRTFDGKPWRGKVDIVCGGFPCQDISCAGKGAGIDGERSGLWGEMFRVVCEVMPRIVFVENSPMLTSCGLGRVLGDLATMGYDARWGVVGADDAGMDHRRKRLWLVADTMRQRRTEMVYIGNQGKRKNSIWKTTHAYSPAHRISRLEQRLGKPGILGANDGLANRVDRLKAIGNGQVPAVVKLAWEILR